MEDNRRGYRDNRDRSNGKGDNSYHSDYNRDRSR